MVQHDAEVLGIQEGLVKIYKTEICSDKPFMKNEIVYIRPKAYPNEKIMCEILRVKKNIAEAQVFEPAKGIMAGDVIEQTGQLLSVTLGPGLIGKIFDGLQSPLDLIGEKHGFFLPRGIDIQSLKEQIVLEFEPLCQVGAKVRAGSILGQVQERKLYHKIMVPFSFKGEFEVTKLHQGEATLDSEIATLKNFQGEIFSVSMQQRWPVRRSLPQNLLKAGYNERILPEKPLLTGLRIIDTFFPIAKGATACIPGPFGAGKTVLQHLISKYSDADIVIVVACGERAGEVVEIINEFPKLVDPKTGGTLIDRTIIICNTSSMPVAAREASIYTGVTIGEYYQQMGYDVLVLADSTSRWAQAMRETSGRMEEIPGEEGFPAYLDSAIRNVYERAGMLKLETDSQQEQIVRFGSMTLIGTVSPAGGNFEEPVTQSTLATVKTFLGLSYQRAYKRFYPAIDPLISWSQGYEQLKPWFEKSLDPLWGHWFQFFVELIQRGDQIGQIMQVTGEEGISLDNYVLYQKARFFDFCYLQQDAFDKVDVSMPIKRQAKMLGLCYTLLNQPIPFEEKSEVFSFFSQLISTFKNLNYSEENSSEYHQYLEALTTLMAFKQTKEMS